MAVAHVKLTDDELRALQEVAAREERSVEDLLRSRIEPLLKEHEQDQDAPIDREELKRRALAAIGGFRSGLKDLAREHDKYLEEAYGDWERS